MCGENKAQKLLSGRYKVWAQDHLHQSPCSAHCTMWASGQLAVSASPGALGKGIRQQEPRVAWLSRPIKCLNRGLLPRLVKFHWQLEPTGNIGREEVKLSREALQGVACWMCLSGWLTVEQKRVNMYEQRSECSTFANQWSLYEDEGPMVMGYKKVCGSDEKDSINQMVYKTRMRLR